MATVTTERFREVAIHSVGEDERDVAYHVLTCVATALGLSPVPMLRWFRPINGLDEWAELRAGGTAPWHSFTTDERVAGQVNQSVPGEIWIRADRGPRRVATVIAHECRHHWQTPRRGFLVNAIDIDAEHAWLEADADSFANTAVSILLKGY